jgi:hypothetical protein
MDKVAFYKDYIHKIASEKILEIENAFDNDIAKQVAYMIATSHEYKTPNVKAALHFTKNYTWEKGKLPLDKMLGINKPIIEDKVKDIANTIPKQGCKPFIVVNQLDAIRPQQPGKKILIDGHHRFEACKLIGISEVPVYIGTYTGGAHKDINELQEKTAKTKSNFQRLQENKVKLTPEERAEVMKRKAVWHFNGGGPSPAVWKSVNKRTGEVTYVTNTHRAYNTASTLKGAIGRFHNFIKSTAGEENDGMDKVAFYKEQIEKTALNAQKAHAMAKEVGLFPEGQWKWALRKLRNMRTGETLKGKELASAKRGMGSMSNNVWQKIKRLLYLK